MTERVLGCDTSHWSGSINFETMYNAGAKFWITKASDAYVSSPIQYEDTKFMEFSTAAIKHGKLLTGCFHWLQASIDPKVAADFYLERYNRFVFNFPPILDFEEKNVFVTGKLSDFAWRAQVWLEYVHEKTGRLPIIYTAKWFTEQFKSSYLSWMSKYPLWVADYTWTANNILHRPFRMPEQWEKHTIWQFSADENGRGKEFGAPGGDIDLNWFEGSYDDLKEFLGAIEIPTPEPVPGPPLPPITTDVRMMVVSDIITIREKPSTLSKKLGTKTKGDVVFVHDFGGSSCWAQLPDGTWCAIEYINKRYLERID